MKELKKIKVLGVGVTDATCENILEYIVKTLENKDEKYYVVTPNPEIVVYASRHPEFKQILNEAKIALADGVGLHFGGQKLSERFTGVDFVEKLCEKVAKKPVTAAFLGGRGRVAERAAECLEKKYSGLKVVYVSSDDPTEATAKLIKDKVSTGEIKTLGDSQKNSQTGVIDILFVAFGHPKQEEWMKKYIDSLPVRVMVGVGGAFDYISGEVPRAPQVIRLIGFEWLFRLLIQPWRIKRQLALPVFVWLVLLEKLKRK